VDTCCTKRRRGRACRLETSASLFVVVGTPLSAHSGMLSLQMNPPRSHTPPPSTRRLSKLEAVCVAPVSGVLACLPAARVWCESVVCCSMTSSPDSGLSLEEQLERKWSLSGLSFEEQLERKLSLESLECVDVQTLISMW